MPRTVSTAVTAIIPTVNRPTAVVAAVLSALEQSHPVHEVIVVHDGDDPNAIAGVRALSDPRIKVVYPPPHLRDAGATARNHGIKHATGDWIAFLDDDDTWLPGKLEAQLLVAGNDNQNVVVSGRVERRSPGLTELWPVRCIDEEERVAHYLFVRRLVGEGWLPTPTLMTRRDFALDHPFTEGLQQHEDLDWLLRLEAAGARFVVVPDVVAVVNVDATRTSLSHTAVWRNSLDWANDRRGLLGSIAFSAFCLTEVARIARASDSPRAILPILRSALSGSPRIRDLAHFAALWLVPRSAHAAANRLRTSRTSPS